MHLAKDKYLCYASEAFGGAAPLLRNQCRLPILLPTLHAGDQYDCEKVDFYLSGYGGEMQSKSIPVNISDQSKPGKRAKAVLVANTLSPTDTKGSAVSGK